MDGYTRFISKGGMFIPMSPAKLKPVGTTIRFQFLLQDGTTAMLGEGVVRQIQGIDSGDSAPVGMLVKFTRLNRDSKKVVDQILERKAAAGSRDGASSENAPPADETPIPAQSTQTQRPNGNSPQNTVEFDSRAADLDDDQHETDKPEDNLGDLFLSPDDAGAPSSSDAMQTRESPEVSADSADSGVDASGNDFFNDTDQANSAEPAKPVEPGASGPKQLGSTEAGLQIMAFDKVSDDEVAGLADFEFGGDEDDVDQMFDDVFGGGDLFGGGGGGGGGFGSDGDADAFGDALIGATAHDGGSPIEQAEEFDDDVEDDELLVEAPADEDSVDESLDDDAEEFDEFVEVSDADDSVDADDFVEDDVENNIEADLSVPLPADSGLAQESSAPSADLMSVLGTLDAQNAEPDLHITLGSANQVAAVTDEEDEEDSLSALLAKAQHDIDAKRESEEADDAKGDIFDDLLGDDNELPPPPKNEPIFDIAAGPDNQKKKKGGFMSKLFGKD
jgi:hypothetical protein